MSQDQSSVALSNPEISRSSPDVSERVAAKRADSDEPNDDEDDHGGIRFKDWGFKVDRLFEVAYRFYKRNESKAFYPSFDTRNQMNALILQARYGNFDNGRAPDIGVLDLVGKSRRHEWSLLKGMSKTEAMSKFICTLDEACPIFKAYAEAVKISSNFDHSATRETVSDAGTSKYADGNLNESESDDQLKATHTSLCRQTYDQFKSYAEKQYPDDLTNQKNLIHSLQEQYYQQYISQMNPGSGKGHSSKQNPCEAPMKTLDASAPIPNGKLAKELAHDEAVGERSPSISPDGTNEYTTVSLDPPIVQAEGQRHQSPGKPGVVQYDPETYPAQPCPSPILPLPSLPLPPPSPQILESSSDRTTGTSAIAQTGSMQALEPAARPKVVDTWSCNSSTSSGAGSPLQQSFSFEPVEPATIWTKKGVSEFKESLIDDKHGGAYVVRQGSLLVIQVPTYPDGRYIYFEFATDDYDIGFGLDFIHETHLSKPLALRIYEETDDEDEDDFDNELYELARAQGYNQDVAGRLSKLEDSETGPPSLDRRRAEKLERLTRTISIVPTYRRDSHTEIFVGRHRYPGQGYYLLKFDNTYSVLRSKSLFFRICFFI